MAKPDYCAEPRNLQLEDAKSRILSSVGQIVETEKLPLKEALGRVLAADLTAPLSLPPFANSAMDGYAFRYADLQAYSRAGLTVIGTSFAGRPFLGEVASGQALRIFTGAAMPVGADTVVMQEHVETQGAVIQLTRAPAQAANVRPAGDEVKRGQMLLQRGKVLQSHDLGVLSSVGFSHVSVFRPLRVAYFSTGDELRETHDDLGYGQIHDSNRYILWGLLQNPAIERVDLGLVKDNPETIRKTLLEAATQADVVISSGGVSVGDADFVTGALADIGRVGLWKVALKPGKPFAFGKIGGAWFFGLPGNPVAVVVTFRQLVAPALLQLIGSEPAAPLRLPARCLNPLKKSAGRMEFQRGWFRLNEQGGLEVEGCKAQGSHQLLGLSHANCFIVLPAESNGTAPGDNVIIEPFDSALA